MESRLQLDILPQPDDLTCGPTCLHAVYRYFGDTMPLEQVIRETPQLRDGGTLAVSLGCHARRRGYEATIFTCNLQVFDPTWFQPPRRSLAERLRAQLQVKDSPKLQAATRWYLEFLDLGGRIQMEDFSSGLIRRYLKLDIPILTGLSATNLYRCAREYGPQCTPDDVQGIPVGHFVVLCGYDPQQRRVLVADPFRANPLGAGHHYSVEVGHVIRSIMLGILTYDANLLIIQPQETRTVRTSGELPGQEVSGADADGR